MGRSVTTPPITIKSVQRGVLTMTGMSATINVGSVDPAKAFLSRTGCSAASEAGDVRLELTSATVITATRAINDGSQSLVGWQLVERY